MKKIIPLLILSFGLWTNTNAQETTTEPVEKQEVKAKYTKATFKSTRIINMQSVEIIAKDNMQFMISHHFGPIWNDQLKTGENFAQMLGLNAGFARTYLSLDYSPLNWANVGVAATGNSEFEGWVKFKILRQQTGKRNIPLTLAWISMTNVDAKAFPESEPNKLAWNKFSFLHQLLIARKFSDQFSLQLMPSVVHFNLVPYGIDNSNTIFSLGLGGKYKLTRNKNLTFEYARQLNMYENLIDKNGNMYSYTPDLVALGMEFDTGGHLFQFYIGNTTQATNIFQLARNNVKIKPGNFALGFTINRGFNLKKDKEE